MQRGILLLTQIGNGCYLIIHIVSGILPHWISRIDEAYEHKGSMIVIENPRAIYSKFPYSGIAGALGAEPPKKGEFAVVKGEVIERILAMAKGGYALHASDSRIEVYGDRVVFVATIDGARCETGPYTRDQVFDLLPNF